MPNPETKEEELVNHLNMSDEDFLNAPVPSDEPEVIDEIPDTDPVSETENETENTDTDEVSDVAPVGDKGAEEETEEVSDDVKSDIKDTAPDIKDISKEAVAIDYKNEYERLLKPFKANGKEISIKSVDDAISLMQMGAGYNKRMEALKPNLRIIKLLENNKLLDVNKLSFLIDLDKKDPKAINKLIKESGIDPVDLDIEKAGEYTPKTHTVDDREIDLDTVLDEIQDTPTYNRTLDVVSKQWDGVSKRAIADQPQILKLINEHMSNGIYDLINTEVESERMLGRLNGVSDIEAYRKIGSDIQARGGFNHLGSSQEKPNHVPPVVVKPKPKAEDPTLKDKRRAAGFTPTSPSGAPVKGPNLLALSDDEFLKLNAPG